MPLSSMMPRCHLPVLLAFLSSLPVMLVAQSDQSANEEERLDLLTRSDAEFYTPKTRVSVGFRMLSSGGQVNFGKLGSVPAVNELIPASAGAANRFYSDGAVQVDSLRAAELNEDGTQKSTPGGRYQVFNAETPAVLLGDFVSYTAGVTREWSAFTEAQLTEKPGYLAMHNYSAVSEGGTASSKQGASGGVELQFARDLGTGTRHLQWGVTAGLSLNDISSSANGSVVSTLHTHTDYFTFNGLTAPVSQLSNPNYNQSGDSDGDGVVNTYENTVPVNALPDPTLSKDVATAGAAAVAGRWQIKGAYFMIKLGPTLRTQITDRFGVSASIGVAGAYAGTRYIANESFSVAALPDVKLETLDQETLDTSVSSTEAKFLTGYYADVNLEWTANDRFGLFGGVTAQQLGDYEQTLEGRTAVIDLGSSVGVRGGVTVRF